MRKNIFYRKGYKGQLDEDYSVKIAVYPHVDIDAEFYTLLETGLLTIRKGYAWDFDTLAIDSRKSKRASLIHDCLYQMMWRGELSKGQRSAADYEYYKALVEDGFWEPWANLRFKAVRRFGGRTEGAKNRRRSAPDKDAVNSDTSGAA